MLYKRCRKLAPSCRSGMSAIWSLRGESGQHMLNASSSHFDLLGLGAMSEQDQRPPAVLFLSAAVRAPTQSAPGLRVLDHGPRTDSESFASPSHTTKSNRPRRPSSESPTRKTNLRSNKLSRPFSGSSGKYNWVVRMRPPGFWTLR
jgi:hypothetical protein